MGTVGMRERAEHARRHVRGWAGADGVLLGACPACEGEVVASVAAGVRSLSPAAANRSS